MRKCRLSRSPSVRLQQRGLHFVHKECSATRHFSLWHTKRLHTQHLMRCVYFLAVSAPHKSQMPANAVLYRYLVYRCNA